MAKHARPLVLCCDKDGNPQHVPRESLVFRPAVYGIIIRDGKILLVPHWDGYGFPGGGIEKGETLDEALAREVKEETGLSVERGDIVACESSFYIPQKGNSVFHSILLYFLRKNIQGTISDAHFEEGERTYVRRAEWVDIKEIERITIYSSKDSARIIHKALAILDAG